MHLDRLALRRPVFSHASRVPAQPLRKVEEQGRNNMPGNHLLIYF